MLNSSKLMFLTITFLSIIMMISSENLISMWMSLEMNMISFIPLMKEKNNKSSEAMMSYFLIQSLSSILFLMCVLMNPNYFLMMETSSMYKSIMMISMCMKIGMPPMHMWIIHISEKISWESIMMLLSIQKINPLWIISSMKINKILLILSVISSVIGAMGGINQTSIKKIMTFSSINHIGWMCFSMNNSQETWIKYLIIYSILLIMMIIHMKKKNILFINQFSTNIKTNMEKINIMLLMMSMGGMPPMIGFLNKWMIIQENKTNWIIMTLIIMTSIITMFFYLRMISSNLMFKTMMNKWMLNYKNKINTENIMIMMNMITPMMIIMIF